MEILQGKRTVGFGALQEMIWIVGKNGWKMRWRNNEYVEGNVGKDKVLEGTINVKCS